MQSSRAPVFETQLMNQCLLPGQTALFECIVSGHPPPEIVWTRRGHPLLDKARYLAWLKLILYVLRFSVLYLKLLYKLHKYQFRHLVD